MDTDKSLGVAHRRHDLLEISVGAILLLMAAHIIAPKQEQSCEPHQFGGCNTLLGQYQTVGAALLEFEATSRYRYSLFPAFTEFRENVAFVPVEVLESYLEDLLDLQLTDQKLWVHRETSRLRSLLIAAVGLLIAVSSGLYAAQIGAALPFAFALTALGSLPFAILMHFAWHDGSRRRVGFAQLVSKEIARRRGLDKHGLGRISNRLSLENWLGAQGSSTTQGVARVIH